MENNYCTVPTVSALHAMQNHEENEYVYCEENEKFYSWQNNEWKELVIGLDGQGVSMNLYELNQSIINQLPVMDNATISQKANLIEELHQNTKNIHYMLLCKEYNYYTIFECDSMLSLPTFSGAVCDIVSKIGEVYSIELTENKDAIEAWIKPDGEETAMVFYLFAYDAGVVYYG